MKTKIVGILVMTLLITTALTAVGIRNNNKIGPVENNTRAIIYHEDHGAGIWRMREDGTGKVQVSDHGWFAKYYGINAIIFGEYYNEGIWIMNAGGVNQQELSTAGDGPHGNTVEQKIVYHVGGTDPTERRIWIMNLDGTNAHQLTDNPGSSPEFSPNGEWIAYHGEPYTGIWLIKPDGTNEYKLYDDGAFPTWSPDGNYIAYMKITDGLIWTMKADGTEHRQVSEFKGIHPDWSPDGDQIAYECYETEPPVGIRVVNADSTNDYEVSSTGHAPDWKYNYNNPPDPPTITGPQTGRINTPHDYTFVTTDPDGDDVLYYIEWGDGDIENWIGPYPSNQDVIISHTYSTEDTFTIRAKARDASAEYESDWAELSVSMPKTKPNINTLFLRLLEQNPMLYKLLQSYIQL